jgi:hypothetical protein
VKLAAALLLVYGAWVVIQATGHQMGTDWADSRGYPRALLRCAGMMAIAFGLLLRARFAWWLGVVMGSFLTLLGIAGSVLLATLDESHQGLPGPPDLTVPILCLGGAVLLLLTPSARGAFRGS